MVRLAQGVLLTRKPDLLSTKKEKPNKKNGIVFIFLCIHLLFSPHTHTHKHLASSHCADKVHSLVLAHFSQTIFRVDYDFSDTEAI